MTRKFHFSIDEYYHIYNRGTDKRPIFLDEDDHQRFLKLLYLCNSSKNIVFRDIPIGQAYGYKRGDTFVDIGAYCLMPNHFHILVREKKEGGTSSFIQKLSTAYSMYFNTKYSRSGGLFEGPFRASHVDTNEYLKYLFSYVHLNPVKLFDPKWKENSVADREGAQKYLEQYPYSSYLDHLGKNREERSILESHAFPEYFGDFKEFKQFVQAWLEFKDP